MFIITGILNEKSNELTICAILCQNIMFYRQEQSSLFQVQEFKMKLFRVVVLLQMKVYQ